MIEKITDNGLKLRELISKNGNIEHYRIITFETEAELDAAIDELASRLAEEFQMEQEFLQIDVLHREKEQEIRDKKIKAIKDIKDKVK